MAAGDVTTNVLNPISYPCASFDGVDDEITANKATLESTQNFTISLWVNSTQVSPTKSQNIISFQPSNLRGVGFQIASSQTVSLFTRNDSSFKTVAATDALTPGSWDHVLGTYTKSNNQIQLFINNVSQGTNTGVITDNSKITTMGGSKIIGGNAEYFKGLIRDIRVYDKVLSSDEIASLYNKKSVTDRLIYHWRLNGNANEEIRGFNGSNNGAAFLNSEETLNADLTSARTTANDKYYVVEAKGKVITAVIEEAP